MNKRLIVLTLLGIFFLIGIVTATIGFSKEVKVDTETSVIINSINNETIERGDIICSEETCTQYMWKGEYNLGSETVDRYKCEGWENQTDEYNDTILVCISEKSLKDSKIIEELTKRQSKRLEELAKTIRKRQEESLKNKQDGIKIEDKGEVILVTN